MTRRPSGFLLSRGPSPTTCAVVFLFKKYLVGSCGWGLAVFRWARAFAGSSGAWYFLEVGFSGGVGSAACGEMRA